MRYTPTLITALVTIAALSPTHTAFARPSQQARALVSHVAKQQGRRLTVQGAAVTRLSPGMSVWISEPGPGGAGGLPIVEAKVQFVHGQQAVVLLPEGAPNIPPRAVVEPRFVAEARLYGQKADVQRPEAETVKPPEPDYRTWHQRPSTVSWNGRLWLELVATPQVQDVELRWRLGRTGRFAPVKMKADNDGMWTASLTLGETAPEIRALQYYIVGKVHRAGQQPEHTALRGHPGAPLTVAITSVPTRARDRMVEHEPPGRVSHNQPLVLTAQVNPRFSRPIVFFRPRGGGSYDAAPMLKVAPGVFRAEIPGKKVVVPGLSYYIAVADEKGIRRDGFANRRSPFHVKVTRGRILSPDSGRNTLHVHGSQVNYGGAGDRYTNLGVRFDRRFFGFLEARLGGEMWTGIAPRNTLDATGKVTGMSSAPLDLYLGNAGMEIHLGNYFSTWFDTVLGIHNEGAALGYEVGGRIGDEAGANLTLSRRAIDDLDSGDELITRFRASLSAPVGQRLRIAGAVVHEDIGQDANRGLRLQVEASYLLGDRFTVSAQGGLAGRDADEVSGTGGLGFGLVF